MKSISSLAKLTAFSIATVGASTLSLTALSTHAEAATLVGNITGVPSSFQFATTSISAAAAGQQEQKKAVEFTTGSTAQLLQSVQLYLAGYDTADTPLVTIFEGDANNPVAGTSVTLGGSNPAPLPNGDPGVGANTVYSFNAFTPSPYTFKANTKYTLVVGASVGTFNWVRDTGSTNVTPTGLATFNAYRFSSNGSPFGGASSLYNNFAINTNAVPTPPVATPEPASVLGFLALGLFGGASALKNKKKN